VGNTTNGLFIGYNGLLFGVCYMYNSVKTWTYSTAFNVDKLDATGSSYLTINPLMGTNYIIKYDGSAYGQAFIYIEPWSAVGHYDRILVHRLIFGGSLATMAWTNSSMKMRASITRTAGVVDTSMYVGSMHASFEDLRLYSNVTFSSYITRSIAVLIAYPMICLQCNALFNDIANFGTIFLRDISITTQGASKNDIFGVCTGAVTGGAYTNVNSTASMASVNTTATAITVGTLLRTASVYGSDGYMDVRDIALYAGQILTFFILVTSGTTQTVTLTINWIEIQ
jgi:hypothetical protein